MFRIAFLALSLVTLAYCRMPYQLSDGYEYVLRSQLDTSFSCEGLPYGYYADEANNCEVFHICLPIADEIGALVETAHFSFFCGNGTVFSQDTLTCSHPEDALPCNEARSFYDISNSEFGVIPQDNKK
ncbi:UNVERIFIED_CONTAM: hypothetical protein RMT77_012299 [Armadillidium vulgare]